MGEPAEQLREAAPVRSYTFEVRGIRSPLLEAGPSESA